MAPTGVGLWWLSVATYGGCMRCFWGACVGGHRLLAWWQCCSWVGLGWARACLPRAGVLVGLGSGGYVTRVLSLCMRWCPALAPGSFNSLVDHLISGALSLKECILLAGQRVCVRGWGEVNLGV
ncbi:hypothetical protein ATANTOWER_017087 [Ataeniobius toweri]|uniref:Secreted protein n=1 Tax=Ataeniobius toweri TaxID=208326 RepID=A0ABU7AS20_9TELE|nr:hypothetical protein [Ataeniobius toweri]